MDQETIKALAKDMKSWGKKTTQKNQVKISAEGIEKALEAGKADYDRREFDKEVAAFMYLANSIMYNECAPKKDYQYPIERLFEILDTRTYRSLMKKAEKEYTSDVQPTDFFRDLYRRYLKWLEKPYRKTTESAKKNYGAKSFEDRWELGEIPYEKWMGKDTVGEDD